MRTLYPQFVTPISDGETVDAATMLITTQQLTQRTDYLKEVLDDLSLVSGRLVHSNAKLDAAVSLYDVVYYDANDKTYKRAMGLGVTDPNTDMFTAAPQSFGVGHVIVKNGVIGTILLMGPYDFKGSGANMDNMVEDGTFTPGKYYLSRKVPGKLTKVPAQPVVEMGMYADTSCFVDITHKDIFEAHYHYNFNLSAKPAASQNFAQNGWTDFGISPPDPAAKKYVDYFNKNAAGTPPPILLTIRKNTSATPAGNIRVDIFRSGTDKMGVTIYQSPDYLDPQSVGTGSTSYETDWPTYGEYIAITGTNLEVAFTRKDQTYLNTLAVDAVALLAQLTDQWKIFLPTDFLGWTNINHLDTDTPAGTMYQYNVSGDTLVNQYFPPVPESSAFLEQNGRTLAPDYDFKIDITGVYWIPGGYTADYTYAPWPHDYSVVGSMNFLVYGKILRLFYIRSVFANENSVVLSLRSNTPVLRVTQCPSGQEATAGHLALTLDLAFGIGATIDDTTNPTAIVSADGLSLLPGYVVREIEAGAGIQISSTTPGKPGAGKVRISAKSGKAEGEVTSITLRNAKESIYSNNVTVVELVPPSQASSAFIARMKLPEDSLTMPVNFDLYCALMGDRDVLGTGVSQHVLMQATYHVVRGTYQLSALTDANAAKIQYWWVEFANYTNQVILADYPLRPTGQEDKFRINPAKLNPTALIAPDGLKAGDWIFVRVERLASATDTGAGDWSGIPNFEMTDDYTGRVGFAGIRWIVQ